MGWFGKLERLDLVNAAFRDDSFGARLLLFRRFSGIVSDVLGPRLTNLLVGQFRGTSRLDRDKRLFLWEEFFICECYEYANYGYE